MSEQCVVHQRLPDFSFTKPQKNGWQYYLEGHELSSEGLKCMLEIV